MTACSVVLVLIWLLLVAQWLWYDFYVRGYDLWLLLLARWILYGTAASAGLMVCFHDDVKS